MVKEVVGFAFYMKKSRAKERRGAEELTLKERERTGQKAFVDTTKIETSGSFPPWIRDGVRCVKRCMNAMLQNRSASGAWEGTTTQEEEEDLTS